LNLKVKEPFEAVAVFGLDRDDGLILAVYDRTSVLPLIIVSSKHKCLAVIVSTKGTVSPFHGLFINSVTGIIILNLKRNALDTCTVAIARLWIAHENLKRQEVREDWLTAHGVRTVEIIER
jgi:hypothetical protein